MSLEWRGAAVESGDGPPAPETWQSIDVPGRPAEFAGESAVAYRTTFEDPRAGDDHHVVLALDGVYAQARVWLDGEQIADHDVYFEPLRVPLDVDEENEVIVECRRPADRFGGLYETDRVPADRCVPGIWWDASLETYPDPYVASLNVAPDLTGTEPAVDVTATVVTEEPLDDRLTLSLRPTGQARGGGMMNRAHVESDAGTASVTHRIDVRDPSLWWPHDVGPQPRYAVRAKLGDAERTVTTGLRSVSYDEDGLKVNGQRVPVRGVNLVDGTPADVDRAVEANANLIRAHASALSPAVYDACDEQGVLVWQDLPLTGPGEFDVERATDLTDRLVEHRRRHPSLAALSIHDDPVPEYATGLGSGLLDRLRYRWRAWRANYDLDAARAVAETVDEVPVFPVVGPAGIDPDAATMYPGWEFGTPGDVEWLCDHYDLGDVVAEFGAGALGTDSPAETADFDQERHEVLVDGGVEASQRNQARVVGTVAESLRQRGTQIMAVYALRDLGDAGMGLRSRADAPKAAFDRLQRAYEPTQVVLDEPTAGKRDVVLLHDRPSAGTATVEWDVDGEREQQTVAVDPFDRETVTTLSLAADTDVTLAVAIGETVAQNTYSL